MTGINIRKCFLIVLLSTMPSVMLAKQTKHIIFYKQGSDVLYNNFEGNTQNLSSIKDNVLINKDKILKNKGHIQIVSNLSSSDTNNKFDINLSSLRGARLREWLKLNIPEIRDEHFSFTFSNIADNNFVALKYIESPLDSISNKKIYYSLDTNDTNLSCVLSKYAILPIRNDSTQITDSLFLLSEKERHKKLKEETEYIKKPFKIYYRWDKHNLDKTFLTNQEVLNKIDSIMHLKSRVYIDSMTIISYASPEGNVDYNQRLSERRGKTIRDYLLSKYSDLRPNQVKINAKGENWDEFLEMAIADTNLPHKERVLRILKDKSINDEARNYRLTRIDGGRLYKNYLLPNYYRYLRNGSSLFVIYLASMPEDINHQEIDITLKDLSLDCLDSIQKSIKGDSATKDSLSTRYYLALRTNLLYDVIGALNIGVEVPIKKFSIIADVAYSYWHFNNNLFAFQTLEYGLELRYWINKNKAQKGSEYKPLKGWNVGIYGKYIDRYDAQFIDGYQGDATYSIGITAGYSKPLNKHLSLEFGLGAGYVSTSEYRHYHKPQYDANGNGYLMWEQTGRWSGFSLTKARVSLVWLLQSKKK